MRPLSRLIQSLEPWGCNCHSFLALTWAYWKRYFLAEKKAARITTTRLCWQFLLCVFFKMDHLQVTIQDLPDDVVWLMSRMLLSLICFAAWTHRRWFTTARSDELFLGKWYPLAARCLICRQVSHTWHRLMPHYFEQRAKKKWKECKVCFTVIVSMLVLSVAGGRIRRWLGWTV